MRFDVLSKLQRAFQPRQKQLRLVVTEDEVSLLTDGKETWRFRWDEVAKVETFKRDIFSMDLICLDFSVEPRKLTYQTHEDMQGFRELNESMCRRFPSVDANWLPQIASPPFATNHKILYERSQ